MFTSWSSARRLKLTVITSTIGRMPAERRTDPGADEPRLRQRGVADPVAAELDVEVPGDAVGAAVVGDVLAHDEDAGVAGQRLADGPRRRASR